ncbi:MAG: DUF3768 domain-containing protein [Beijerinckiaceae bacterium]
MLTAGVTALTEHLRTTALQRMTAFDAFDADNDPHQEHDFGAFDVGEYKFFWKIDYYDPDLRFGSENPADPAVTTRVLTLMLAEEY